MTVLLPEGFRDSLPPHADAAAEVEARILAAARLHGYERADPPLAEFADSLESRLKAGGLHDAVRFVDPVSQRTLAIRPDLTAQVARIATTRMAHHPRPVRLSYAGSVLKLRASELAPARERRQIGCELIGLDSVAAAREVVTVAVDALAAAGATGVSIDFTLPDLVNALAVAMPVVDADALRDRLDAKDAGGVAAIAPDYLPLIAAAGPFASAVDRLRAFDTRDVLASRLDGLAEIVAALGARDDGRLTLTLDPTERHGFEYQTWLGFSLFAAGSSREVGRGGTYTVMREDGSEEAATGFSLFADALIGDASIARRRLFLPFGTPPAAGAAMRAAGWITVAALEAHDTPEAQLCTHLWVDGTAQSL